MSLSVCGSVCVCTNEYVHECMYKCMSVSQSTCIWHVNAYRHALMCECTCMSTVLFICVQLCLAVHRYTCIQRTIHACVYIKSALKTCSVQLWESLLLPFSSASPHDSAHWLQGLDVKANGKRWGKEEEELVMHPTLCPPPQVNLRSLCLLPRDSIPQPPGVVYIRNTNIGNNDDNI